MKYTELKSDLQKCIRQIYLLEGNDAYFRLNGEEMIKKATLEMPELNYSAFDGEKLKGSALATLIGAIESFPFMSEKRVIKVTNLYITELDYEKYLKKTFDNFPQTSVLIIVNAESRKGVELKRKKVITYVDCDRADIEDVEKWIYFRLKKEGLQIEADASESIARYCLCDMARVSVEVEKIIAYKVSGIVTKEDVDELVYKEADYKIYEMTQAMAKKDFDKFCLIKNDLCRKSGDEVFLLSGLLAYCKNLLTILTSNSNSADLASELGLKEFILKKSKEQAYAIGEEKIRMLTKELYKSIANLKSGFITPQNAILGVCNKIFFE